MELKEILYHRDLSIETYCGDFTVETLPWRLYHRDFTAETLLQRLKMKPLLWRLYCGDLLWRLYCGDLLWRLYQGDFILETLPWRVYHRDLPQRLYHRDFSAETYHRDFTTETLSQRLYCGDLPSYFEVIFWGLISNLGGWWSQNYNVPSLFVLGYHWLPLTTIDLVGNNKAIWTLRHIWSVWYQLWVVGGLRTLKVHHCLSLVNIGFP